MMNDPEVMERIASALEAIAWRLSQLVHNDDS